VGPLVVAAEMALEERRAFRVSWAKEANAEPMASLDSPESRANRENQDPSTRSSKGSPGSQATTVSRVVADRPALVAHPAWPATLVAPALTALRVKKAGRDSPVEREFRVRRDLTGRQDSEETRETEQDQWDSTLRGTVSKQRYLSARKALKRCGMDIR